MPVAQSKAAGSGVLLPSPPVGSRTRFKYGKNLDSTTKEDPAISCELIKSKGEAGNIPYSEKHRLARFNVISIIENRKRFEELFNRWRCLYVNMDEVKAVSSDILGCFLATLGNSCDAAYGVSPPPQFMNDILVDVKAKPIGVRIARACRGQASSSMSQPQADPLKASYECMKACSHCIEFFVDGGLSAFRPAVRPRPLPRGGRWEFVDGPSMSMAWHEVVPDETGTMLSKPHCTVEACQPVVVFTVDTGSTMFRTYLQCLVTEGLRCHFLPGHRHRESNAVAAVFALAGLQQHFEKLRWLCGPFVRGPVTSHKEGITTPLVGPDRMGLRTWHMASSIAYHVELGICHCHRRPSCMARTPSASVAPRFPPTVRSRVATARQFPGCKSAVARPPLSGIRHQLPATRWQQSTARSVERGVYAAARRTPPIANLLSRSAGPVPLATARRPPSIDHRRPPSAVRWVPFDLRHPSFIVRRPCPPSADNIPPAAACWPWVAVIRPSPAVRRPLLVARVLVPRPPPTDLHRPPPSACRSSPAGRPHCVRRSPVQPCQGFTRHLQKMRPEDQFSKSLQNESLPTYRFHEIAFCLGVLHTRKPRLTSKLCGPAIPFNCLLLIDMVSFLFSTRSNHTNGGTSTR